MSRALFRRVTLDELDVDDEAAVRHVGLYWRLKERLARDRYLFRVPTAPRLDWNRATLLNLAFWTPGDGADVLEGARIPADVVAHVAWHHSAAAALGSDAASADGLLLAESIASAFDLYLVGRLLGYAPKSSFLATQVPAMADVAESAGLSATRFEAMLRAIARDPEGAFSDLRALLFAASSRLARVRTVDEAARALERFADHRFAALLHHYNLSNWVLYTRAWAPPPPPRVAPAVAAIDRALRRPRPLAWLERRWLDDEAR